MWVELYPKIGYGFPSDVKRMILRKKSAGFLDTALICLALLAVWPTSETQAQRRRQPKSVATLTVKASIYYQLGGVQPIPPTAFYVLDEHPDTLLSFLGEAPVLTYAVAKISGESLKIARLKLQLAQARDGYMREQIERTLDLMQEAERAEARAAFGRNERYAPDKDTILKASAILFNSTIAREVTDNNGVAVFRGLPAGRTVYLLGMAPTRGGVVVWLFEATMKPGNNGTQILNQANALFAF